VDHIRAISLSISDGQLPSNNKAGYVIRRILRRAIRYGFTFLNTKEAFIYQLVEVLSNQMQDFFPEIKTQKELVINVIREEENSFLIENKRIKIKVSIEIYNQLLELRKEFSIHDMSEPFMVLNKLNELYLNGNNIFELKNYFYKKSGRWCFSLEICLCRDKSPQKPNPY
jgi:Leucine-rich repeat (LRR) protein